MSVQIMVHNAYSSLGQATYTGGFTSNVSLEPKMSVEEFNRSATDKGQVSEAVSVEQSEPEEEPAFGEHIREAAGVVRRVFQK